MNYYNEIDLFAAEWLRNLIKKGLIPDGEVDTRTIVDVAPDDLNGFVQCHFFAGIGGWSHALRLARWPDDRPIWTGSCPCQPFSVAGKGAGTDDPRHLWPHFHRLITAVRPPVVMGEQVAGAAGYGWLDGVRADLEREGYASRGVDIPACSVDAPHIRQRLYWVACDMADANGYGSLDDKQHSHGRSSKTVAECRGRISSDHMADAGCEQRSERCKSRSPTENRTDRGEEDIHDQRRSDGDMADADSIGGNRVHERIEPRHMEADTERDGERKGGGFTSGSPFWSDHIWLNGADGKARRVEPTIRLLAHGVPGRVGRLRAYGNAIVPQVAAEVIKAFMES
jgi:DNA (cytosine-5)-methyltransferase 1